MYRPVTLVALCLCVVAGCAMQRAERTATKQANEYCAEQGKTPIQIEKKVHGNDLTGATVGLVIVCVDPKALIATNPEFGVDMMPDPRTRGATVVHVLPGSVAERIGLRTNDTVYEYNAQPIESAEDLQRAVAHPTPGELVVIKWSRRLQEMSGSARY